MKQPSFPRKFLSLGINAHTGAPFSRISKHALDGLTETPLVEYDHAGRGPFTHASVHRTSFAIIAAIRSSPAP